MKKALLIVAGLLTAGLIAQTQQDSKFSDRQNRFAVWYRSFSADFSNPERVPFEVSGNPVRGYSRDQNLEFSANDLEGDLRRTKEGKYLLTRGVASGGAIVTITDQKGTSIVQSGKVTLSDNGEVAAITLPGAFSFTNSSKTEKAHRSMKITGARGTFNLKSLAVKDANPLLNGEVTGPVTINVDEKDAKGKAGIYKLTGQRMTIRSEGSDKVVTMSGGVHIEGQQDEPEKPGYAMNMEMAEATIIFGLDAEGRDYEIKKITGGAGKGTLREKKDGS